MIVEIKALPQRVDPKQRERRFSVAFDPQHVILVREFLNVMDGEHTMIVFRGDTYEHHAVETDMPYEDVMKLIGWRKG